jgi:hypothetical protein
LCVFTSGKAMATKTCSDLSVDQARTGTLQPGTWLGLLFQVVLSEPRRLALHQARLVRRKAVDSEPHHLVLSEPRRLVRRAVGSWSHEAVHLASLVVQPDLATMVASG